MALVNKMATPASTVRQRGMSSRCESVNPVRAEAAMNMSAAVTPEKGAERETADNRFQ